jgi:hypothetical protein
VTLSAPVTVLVAATVPARLARAVAAPETVLCAAIVPARPVVTVSAPVMPLCAAIVPARAFVPGTDRSPVTVEVAATVPARGAWTVSAPVRVLVAATDPASETPLPPAAATSACPSLASPSRIVPSCAPYAATGAGVTVSAPVMVLVPAVVPVK